MIKFHVLHQDLSYLFVFASSIEEVERAFPKANITNFSNMESRIIKFPLK